MESNLSDCLRGIGSFDGYGSSPMPNIIDSKMIDCLKKATSNCNFNGDIGEVLNSDALDLLAFAERCASMAVRVGDIQYVYWAMIAIGFCDNLDDQRMIFVVLSLLNDACERLNATLDDNFQRTKKFSTTKMGKLIISFVERDAVDKSIVAMGFSVSSAADDFRYVCNW